MFFRKDPASITMPLPQDAPPDGPIAIEILTPHHVLGTSLHPPFPEGMQSIVLGMGCFWGAERKFWQIDGVHTTAVGYAGGHNQNPTYKQVCTGQTGHTEVVLVVYDPEEVHLKEILKVFWESHDPTQWNRQGNDVGTQYRSALFYTTQEQAVLVETSREAFQEALNQKDLGTIATQMDPLEEVGPFFYAEEYHQQYLSKDPGGYCGLRGTGATCIL